MRTFLFSLARIIGIVIAVRLVFACFIAGFFESLEGNIGLAIIAVGPLLLVSFLALFGLPFFFCKSAKDAVAVVMTYGALIWISEVTYNRHKAALAKEYATPALATPDRVHETAVIYGDQCAFAPYRLKFRYIVCITNDPESKRTWTEAAPDSECKERKIERQNDARCYVPIPPRPITEALAYYPLGIYRPPIPLTPTTSLRLPKNSASNVITEVVDGKEKVLGRSFWSWDDSFFVNAFFGFPSFFGAHDWSKVEVHTRDLPLESGADLLETLQERAASKR